MATSPFEAHGNTISEAFPGLGSAFVQTRDGRVLSPGYGQMLRSINEGTANTIFVRYAVDKKWHQSSYIVNPLGDENVEVEATIGRGGSGGPVFLVDAVEFVTIT